MSEQWVALFRGINVGGHNKLPMKELISILTDFGFENPRTVIQSGNAVFGFPSGSPTRGAEEAAKSIEGAVEQAHGFRPAVLILDEKGFRERLAANPFPEATAAPKALHMYFCASAPEHPNVDEIESRRAEREQWQLVGDVFYLHAPDGIGCSKLAASVERLLGVPTTGRNWNTLLRIVAILDA